MAELGLNAALLIVWTLVIRVFPSVLGTAFEKRIAHGYDNKLEKIKAEYSTLKTSVDFLSTTQSELRAKVIESDMRPFGVPYLILRKNSPGEEEP